MLDVKRKNKNFSAPSLILSICLIVFSLFGPPVYAQIQFQIPSLFQAQTNAGAKFVSPISSADFQLIWSTNTYTPFTYLGKPLPTFESLIRVSLVRLRPTEASLDNLIYKWYLDGVFQKYSSGKGRQVFLFRINNPANSRVFIDLKIEDEQGNVWLKLSTSILVIQPEVVLYPSDSQADEGALANARIVELRPGQEQNFVALPFFFNITSPTDLEYQWNFNGQNIIKIDNPNYFSIRVAEGELEESFVRDLSVFVANPRLPIQSAANKIEVTVKSS